MNVSLSSLERLLQRYTMESTTKPFDVRSVPVEAVPSRTTQRLELFNVFTIANENDFFFL